ncbi:hypothetical protein DSLASN_19540 [Desulfoluna limicola]|uniref:SbsA Ig-like domain-containing protein n=2 Tax=Desulfoluna limicola TaxID=2810562 RepID=A0ABN6F4W5_9BACT|nr:hypothetical protein DSLASN_19540 [Desulfoluna limicola]
MPYHISILTPGARVAELIAGVSRWNDLEMSTFEFLYQGLSSKHKLAADGINLINIDSNFDTNTGLGGQGILAISTTWTLGEGTDAYRAVESDIVFNGEEFPWGDGTAGTVDTEAVSVHESGHSAGLSHAGSICRESGSEGCGAEVPKATMYWNFSAGQPTNKATLELDDAAALISAYPTSTFRVQVVNATGDPMPGVTVLLLDAAAPVNGTNRFEGGLVYGDVTNSATLMGDQASSLSYINQTPFNLTDISGFTNFINPSHRTIRITATAAGITRTISHTVANSTSTLAVTLEDRIPPVVISLSPASGSTDAPQSGPIRAEFNESMNAATLTPLTFTNSQGLSGSVTYDVTSRIASFTPASSLAPLTTYTFTLTTGIQDTAGNALASPVVWSFTTKDSSSSSSGGCFIEVVGDK